MQTIYILTEENHDYDSYSHTNISAYENNDDALAALERIKTYYKICSEANTHSNTVRSDWVLLNPMPKFDRLKPQHDPALINDKNHMREHSRRMQEWNTELYKFEQDHVTPWCRLNADQALSAYTNYVTQKCEELSIDPSEFNYKYNAAIPSVFEVESIPFSMALMANEIKLG